MTKSEKFRDQKWRDSSTETLIMPLSKIIQGDENSALLLLTDSLHNPAVNLLKARLKGLTNNLNSVHLYIFELRKDQIIGDLPRKALDKIEIHDFTVDPFGWSGLDQSLDVVLPSDLALLKDDKSAVVIDSISTFVHMTSPQVVCHWIHRLSQTCQVTAVLHRDLHSDAIVHTMEYIADVIVTLPDDESSSCTIVRRTSGKLPKITKETFSIDDELNVRSSEIFEKDSVTVPQVKKAAANPADNLTFNLRISKNESDARSRVKLPYVQTSEDAAKNINAVMDSLDVDDLEEDPDDDLDI